MKKILTGIILFIGLQLHAQSLDDYLKEGAENNPNLQSKFKVYLAALEKVDQQKALPDPSLSFGYFISPIETRVGPQNMRLSLSQMFPWFGTRKVRAQAAASWAKVKFEEFQETKNKLFLEIQTAWLKLQQTDQESILLEKNLQLLKSYEPITKTKYEANLVPLTELIRVQIRIEEAQTELDLLALKRKMALGDFNVLLNRSLDEEVETTIELLDATNLSLTSDSLSNAPSIRAAKEKLKALDHQIDLAEFKRKPNIGVGLDYAMVNKREGVSIPDNGKDVLMPMVSLSLPIFGSKNRALKKQTLLEREGGELMLESLTNRLDNEWRKSELQEDYASRQLTLLEKEIKSTELLLKLLTSEYSNSNTGFEELLLAQQKLLQLKRSEIKSNIDLLKTYYKKQYLVGSDLTTFKSTNHEK